MCVITISRQFGSGGDEIAELICSQTGYQLFDKHVLARAAADAGLSVEEIIAYTEGSRKMRSFLDRLFGRPEIVAQVSLWKEEEDGTRTRQEVQLDERNAMLIIQKAIETAYQMGRMVIVGRGGQVILKDRPGVLHVRIEAPLEERLIRVRHSVHFAGRAYNDSVQARRAAQDLIEAQDGASANYLTSSYAVDWSDPTLYHLVINTSKLKIEQAAKVIVDAARLFELAPETA